MLFELQTGLRLEPKNGAATPGDDPVLMEHGPSASGVSIADLVHPH
jgi:hypothetical protein